MPARAIAWLDEYGDLDGDGLWSTPASCRMPRISPEPVGGRTAATRCHFADGRAPRGPIALVEVQGYAFAACKWLAEAVRLRGNDVAWADELDARAEAIRKTSRGPVLDGGRWLFTRRR